jgi:urate oxidase
MTFVLSQSNYGKSAIRLVKVMRDEGRHELSDVTVDVMLDGDFRAAHDEGDNSALIATDTMRNAVYVLAAKHDVSELETFGRALVEHFVAAGPTVQRAQVRLVAHPPETDDRILATAVSARWTYAEGGIDYSASWQAARDAILEAFGDHYSPSVQFTLRRMGRAVLKAVDAIDRVRLSLPNRHHLLYDLSRFGLENANEVFQATTEPYGLIEGTVERAHL